jgi:hypothetical protein
MRPVKTYLVEILVYNEATGKYFAQTVCTTSARSKNEAQNNVKTYVRVHIGRCEIVKLDPKDAMAVNK